MEAIRRIIWAIDPYADSNLIDRNAARLLKSLARGRQVEIRPVYVMTPDRVHVPAEIFLAHVEQISKEASEAFKKLVGSFRIPGLRQPSVIIKPIVTTRGAVEALDEYARLCHADAILVGTHGRKGVPRLFLGSFAETLILHARTPAIVVGPKSATGDMIRQILFPTDLGENASEDLDRVLAFAKAYGARITIFHQLRRPSYLRAGLREVAEEARLTAEQLAIAERSADLLVDQARRRGVAARAYLSSKRKPLEEEILSTARSLRAGLIAMAPQTGRFENSLVGSSTRHLIRRADRPVWILRESAIATGARRAG